MKDTVPQRDDVPNLKEPESQVSFIESQALWFGQNSEGYLGRFWINAGNLFVVFLTKPEHLQ